MDTLKAFTFGNHATSFGPVEIPNIHYVADPTTHQPMYLIAEGPFPGQYRELFIRDIVAKGELLHDRRFLVIDPAEQELQFRLLTRVAGTISFKDDPYSAYCKTEIPWDAIQFISPETRAMFEQLELEQ